MMSSPPSARTGSSLYMHLPAVQTSSYIFGVAQERMVWNGLSLKVRCSLWDRFAGRVPCGFRRSGDEAGEIFFGVHHHAEAELVRLDHRAGTVHDLADRRPFGADYHGIGDHRSEPVEEIQNVRAAHAGKQIFVATGETNHFMRENRADNDDLVVFKNQPVDGNVHVHLEQPAGEFTDLLCGDDADVGERGRIVPGVVEQADAAVLAGPLLGA